MSLSSVSSDSAEFRTVSRQSAWYGVSSVSSASMVMPMMPFIGVRISWLMLARKSLLARVASSAASFALASSCWASARSVVSRMTVRKPTGRPFASRSSDTDCSSVFSTSLTMSWYSNALTGMPVW